jgi:hypothetical protein
MPSREFLAASALIATALAVSAPAQATTFAGNGSSTIVDGTGAFYDSAIPAGTFTDTINFSVPTSGTQDVNLIYFKITSGLTNLVAAFNGTPITFTASGKSYSGSLSTLVNSGPQELVISGTSGGKGSYSGNVTFTSAVPELATWLMMIAGIGFTGVAMRRRKADYKVNYAF